MTIVTGDCADFKAEQELGQGVIGQILCRAVGRFVKEIQSSS